MAEKEELLEMLPPRARAKFEKMQRHAKTLRHAVRGYYDDIAAVRETLGDLTAHWTRQRQSSNDYTLPEPADAEKLRKKIARLSSERDAAAEAADIAAAPVQVCRQWLVDMAAAGARIVLADPVEAKLAKSGDVAKTVDAIRKKAAALASEYQSVEVAPAPRGDLKKRALEAIAELAELGQPHVYMNKRVGDPINLADGLRLTSLAFPDGRGTLNEAAAQFVAWALADVLAERVVGLIERTPCEGALSDDERDTRLCELAAEMLVLERQEEDLIEKAEAAGMLIARRGDADPRAILGVVDVVV